MPTQTDGHEEVVEETTQIEETNEELSTLEQPTEEVIEETQEPELSEDAKPRTKEQFDKLKAHNAELKRQLEERQAMPSVLDYLSGPMPQVQPQVRQQYQQFVPQVAPQETPEALVNEDGYVNTTVLQRQLDSAQEARTRAEEAERRAMEAQERIARFEQDNEQKELYKEYPELDPLNENFNPEAYELVRNELTSQIVNTGKRNAISAAQKMEKYFRTPQQNTKVLEQRRQVIQPQSAPRQSDQTDLDELRLRSRNDPDAVAERLRRLGM